MEQNNVEKEPLGFLFGNLVYYNLEDLDSLIDNLKNEQSFFIIKLACDKAINSGIFDLAETELLLKSLRKMNTPEISNVEQN